MPAEQGSTENIVREFFATFGANGANKDWQSLLSEDFAFSSPMDKTSGKDAFVPLDTQFRQLVRAASIRWIVTEGGKASALVTYELALPTGDTLVIEFSENLVLRDQKIKSIKVLFDTATFYGFLAKMVE